MKPGPLLILIALPIAAAIGVVLFLGSLENARRPARGIRALNLGHDLVSTTNYTMVDGTTKEFTADLVSILAAPTRHKLDRWQPGDRRGSVRLIIENELGQALHMQLQEEHNSEGFRFFLLSYRKITNQAAQRMLFRRIADLGWCTIT